MGRTLTDYLLLDNSRKLLKQLLTLQRQVPEDVQSDELQRHHIFPFSLRMAICMGQACVIRIKREKRIAMNGWMRLVRLEGSMGGLDSSVERLWISSQYIDL